MEIEKKEWEAIKKRIADLECLMTQYIPPTGCNSITTELRLNRQKEKDESNYRKSKKGTKNSRNLDEYERILRSVLDELEAIHLTVDLINMAQGPITFDCINQPAKVGNESVQRT